MRKIYTTLSMTLLCAPLALFSQISIDDNDMPSAGDTLQYSIGFDIGIDVDDTGPNHVWDFSTIFPIQMDADTFVDVGDTPFLYQFFFNNGILYPDHNATEAVKGTDVDFQGTTFENLFEFYKNDGGAYKNVGFGATINGLPLSIRRIPVDHVYQFPMNYGNVDSSYSEFSIGVPLIGHFGESQWRHNEVDGWGSITTPYGTFDALRVKSTLNRTDTVYIDALNFGFSIDLPQMVEYKWLADGEGIPVMQINTTFGIPTLIKYKDDDDLSTGQEDIEGVDMVLYPNPTNGRLNISIPKNHDPGTIEIFDLNGRIVWSGRSVGTVTDVDLSQLDNGRYLLRYISGSSVINSSFLVAR